ncbi:glutathione S-transferase family protein [Phenylobacterium sp.]|uniref:glutathione S-transferase family protein n=1 Tax=Phenylobacterium sp. TaxID=1871053 RepID=UPI002811D33F|nr:glutathione S-transferase family protein [Phenylobacterium sp.]
MKLLSSGASPYARKVAVAAHEAGLIDRIEIVSVTVSPVSVNPEVSAANPLTKVPTLLLDDGAALFDSRVIVDYLDELSGGRLVPAGAARWPALRDQAAADGLMDAALLARYERALRPEALRWAEWDAGQIGKIERALDTFEAGFTPSARAPQIGDIALACALSYLDFRFADLGWRNGRSRLAAFAEAFNARPSMQATQPA